MPIVRATSGADFFFFNDTATTEIYTLSLHDALPIFSRRARSADTAAGDDHRPLGGLERRERRAHVLRLRLRAERRNAREDRKSTRLNSSHGYISYAVFCLKKKKNTMQTRQE